MRFNILHRQKSLVFKKSVWVVLGVVVFLVYIFMTGNSGIETERIGYIREVYRDKGNWVAVFDEIDGQIDSNSEAVGTPLYNLDTIVLANRLQIETQSFEVSYKRNLSPLDFYRLINTSGARFQKIPFVVILKNGVVVRLEEII